ncbi:MAG: hypothetical protein JSR46_09070, partial [Verrucomicrobia bacterium]|nr:hypothetical protein [Verrucomicrobiota bacterium]
MSFKKIVFTLPFFCVALLFGDPKRQALYQSLDPTSISQHLAFCELYGDTDEGRLALQHAWKLLSSHSELANNNLPPLSFPHNINSFISLINPSTHTSENLEISAETLSCIEQISKHLPNRKYKGYSAKTIEEVLALPSEEIDLSRAILLSQLPQTPEACHKMRSYLATLDLMALQILARLPKEASADEKVRALNSLIFYEMGFRFPLHSAYSNQIDHFTFLPAVLESRKGVCLGVSTLVLCLAQRLDLPLEIITPPGHIYIRAQVNGTERNIETTLRGVHIHSDEYLGINTKKLHIRTLKEVIGMAHFNQASVWLAQSEWQKAADAYKEALRFTPEDRLTKMLYGCSLLLSDRDQEAKVLLKQAQTIPQPFSISPDILVDDILLGNVDKESLRPLFLYVDETRKSIVKKKEALA